jgi:XTP/dITP diphosphohydrolase
MQIVLASHNLHKIREFRDILKSQNKFLKTIDFLSLLDFPHYQLPEESGKSFLENATLKAVDAASVLNSWVIADDSGLVVPALEGAPGILSRRYAGEEASDGENRQKLLNEMRDLKEFERHAYFECCLVLASPEGVKKTVTGLCEGKIIDEEKGRNGFGYDPLFVKNDYDKTLAELDEATKNRISHRYKAIEKLLVTLETL